MSEVEEEDGDAFTLWTPFFFKKKEKQMFAIFAFILL